MSKLTKTEGNGTLYAVAVVFTSVHRNLSRQGVAYSHETGTHEEVQGNIKSEYDGQGDFVAPPGYRR